MLRLVCGPAAALLMMVVLSGCSDTGTSPPTPSRAVTFATLKLMNPAAIDRVTGSVESWKREEVGFEVSGRVLYASDPGVAVEGRTYDERGEMISPGTVIAEIDPKRYVVALQQAEAEVAVAEARATATRIEIEKVLPQKIRAAKSILELQSRELTRYRKAIRTNAVAEAELDRAEAAYATSQAEVSRLEATLTAKRAELESLLAAVRMAEEGVRQAELDVQDCTLSVPFSGQIARAQVIPGGYVQAGEPVFTVQMMDPMKVDVAVGPAVDARLQPNDRLRVYVPGVEEPLIGLVYFKDTYADPTTRTFLVTLLVGNRLVEPPVPEGIDRTTLPSAGLLLAFERLEPDSNPYMEVSAIREDEQGHYVWQAVGITESDLIGGFDPLLTVRKVRVRPGKTRRAFVVYTYRELTDIGGLDPDQAIVLGEIDGEPTDGGQVLVGRERWVLRPGDLATVDLGGHPAAAGFFVPERAIQFDGSDHAVWLARSTASGESQAVRVRVHPGPVVGELQRIEPAEVGALEEGSRVIVDGAHYVIDGERVNLTRDLGATR